MRLDRRIDSTPETELVPNDSCLHVRALAAKWPFLQTDQARMEHDVTSKSAIEVSIPVPC
jgi:hypothetical protein